MIDKEAFALTCAIWWVINEEALAASGCSHSCSCAGASLHLCHFLFPCHYISLFVLMSQHPPDPQVSDTSAPLKSGSWQPPDSRSWGQPGWYRLTELMHFCVHCFASVISYKNAPRVLLNHMIFQNLPCSVKTEKCELPLYNLFYLWLTSSISKDLEC